MILFVTVVFNDLQGLNDTIKSLEQAHHLGISFKHIIIDGQSTDGTKEFIECLKVPYELVWVSEDDHGIYDAMNKGIEMANGGYLFFLGSSSTITPGAFFKISKTPSTSNSFSNSIFTDSP